MKIYPINQSPIVFRGANQQKSSLKRYCEPRTGVYYYYDSNKIDSQKSNSSIIKNITNTFTSFKKQLGNYMKDYNNTPDDILWL